MGRRTNLIQHQIEQLIAEVKMLRDHRNDLRDNYQSILAEANRALDETIAERDERLIRLNELRALEGLPPLTLQDIRQEG